MQQLIYFDYNATTPLCPEARQAMLPFLDGAFGNPSSYHRLGRQARSAVESARRSLAAVVGCSPKEVLFTSGGTEANNLALRGAALAASLRGEIPLDDAAFDLLLEACDCHTRGPRPGAHITVLTCLDADRLDLPRVGIQIRPDLLCTEAARERAVISWAGGRAARRELPRLCMEQWSPLLRSPEPLQP